MGRGNCFCVDFFFVPYCRYNSPSNPIVGYGFEDSVAKTGALNYASLLTLEACALLCQAAREHAVHDPAVAAHAVATEALCLRAANISRELGTYATLGPDFRPFWLL